MGEKQPRSSSRREMSKLIARSFVPSEDPESVTAATTSQTPPADFAETPSESPQPPEQGREVEAAIPAAQEPAVSKAAKAPPVTPRRPHAATPSSVSPTPTRRGRGRPPLGAPEPEIGGKVAVNSYLPPELYLRMKNYVATPGAQESTITGLMTAAVRDYLDREEDLLLEQQRARERRLHKRSA